MLVKKLIIIFIITLGATFCENLGKKEEGVDKKTGRRNTMILLSLLAVSSSYALNPTAQDNDMAFVVEDINRTYYNNALFFGGVTTSILNCSEGGTVTLGGTASTLSGKTTFDLTYSYLNCLSSGSLYSGMLLNGNLTRKGNFTSSSRSIQTISSSFLMKGNLVRSSMYLTPNFTINQTCNISLNVVSSSSMNGTLCGRNFGY